MKRIFFLVLVFFMALVTAACNSESAPVSFSSNTSETSDSAVTESSSASFESCSDTSNKQSKVDSAAAKISAIKQNSSTVSIGGISPLQHTYTFKAPALSGGKRKQLQANPNRGFRLENYMSVENGMYTPSIYDQSGEYQPEKGAQAVGWLYKFYDDYATPEAPQVVQTYFYLTQYNDKDLDQKAFDNMNAYFEACRALGVTNALRFAYIFSEHAPVSQDCTSLAQMLRHMEQLKPILKKNRDVLFCLEAGFFGEWGEQSGGSSWWINGQAGAIMDGVMEMVPSDLWVVCRYYWVYEKTSPSLRGHLGLHNDYLVGFSHNWDAGGNWSSATYKSYLNTAQNVLMEGEMPWGGQLPNNMKNLDGWGVTKYLQNAHFTVLSCYHNNREGGMTHDMKLWRDLTITPTSLNARDLRFYNAWFYDVNGKTVTRSLFDYIQDHLGYLIQSSDMTVKKDGAKITSSFTLNNYGFAAPLAMKQLMLVLLDENDKIVASQQVCRLVDLQAGASKSFNISLTSPNPSKAYRVGLFLEAPNGRGAKFANDLPLVAGVNVFGTMS